MTLEDWDRHAPCKGMPGFVQYGEDPNWATSDATNAAITLCNNWCPFRRECSTRGITAADGAPPDGAVYGGHPCTGLVTDLHTLHDIAGIPRPVLAPVADPVDNECRRCHRALVAKTTAPGEGQAKRGAQGYCLGCYLWAKRHGHIATVTTIHTTDTRDRALAMLDAGDTTEHVADVLQITDRTLRRWKKAA